MPCASAFLTSDCEIPNCLAIADGLTPALKAARTAFSLPVVNETPPYSAASCRRCGFASATRFSFAGLGGRRPRRSASVVTATSRASISTSSNRFSAPAKSFGNKWRCCEARLFGPALPFGTAEGPAAVTVEIEVSLAGCVHRLAAAARCRPENAPPQRDTARRILGAAGGANKRVHLTAPAICSLPLVIRHPPRTSTPKLPSGQNLKCQIRVLSDRPILSKTVNSA